MVTGILKSKIDKLWTEFWTGGITNPLTVIEQISYLMFLKMLEIKENKEEKRALRLKREFKSLYPDDKKYLRWSNLKNLGGDEMLKVVRDELFPYFKEEIAGKSSVGIHLKNAQFMIQKPSLLVTAVKMVDDLPLESGDTKGNLYEYLLSKLTTAGINGQFRTPRHIIRAMVELINPKPTDKICDPACGTAGFLVSVMEYLKEKFTSPELVEVDGDGSKVYHGDLLHGYDSHIQNEMLTGFEFDSSMLSIASLNLLLHGIKHPSIIYQDTLSSGFIDKQPGYSENAFDVILANPPFKGSLDHESVEPSLLRTVKTKKTELLFLALMLRLLKLGGRCAVIVPDGVLFGASKAHVGIRKELLEENQLEAVISLPSGVFKPYAGVSTAVLLFTKGGNTEKVWFYDLQNDGFSLDDKRTAVEGEELTDLIKKYHSRESFEEEKRTKHFFISADEIRKNRYDLSINRYKEIEYEEVKYDEPQIILDRIKTLNSEITTGVKELEEMLF